MNGRHILMALVTALVWGLNFVVIKVGLDAFPPLFFSALRFTCAAFPAVFFIRRGAVPWRTILVIGAVLGVVKYSLLFLGIEAGMPAGLSSLAIQMQVPFTILLAAFVLGDEPGRIQKVGIAVALTGIGVIAVSRGGEVTLSGLALVIEAALAWSVANILLKRSGGADPFRLMVWMSLVPPLPLLLLSALFEEGQVSAVANMDASGLVAVLYTGLVATVIAFGLWGRLLHLYPAATVTPFALLVPIFGVASSALFLHEPLTAPLVVAMTLVLVGLAVVVLGPRILSATTARDPRVHRA